MPSRCNSGGKPRSKSRKATSVVAFRLSPEVWSDLDASAKKMRSGSANQLARDIVCQSLADHRDPVVQKILLDFQLSQLRRYCLKLTGNIAEVERRMILRDMLCLIDGRDP